MNCSKSEPTGVISPVITPALGGSFDFYDWNLSTEIDKASDHLGKIVNANIMNEVLGTKPSPVGEIITNLAKIPVPNLLIDIDKIDKYNLSDAKEKIYSLPPKGDVAFNYDDNMKGNAKITDIVYTRDYQGAPKITITGIILDK